MLKQLISVYHSLTINNYYLNSVFLIHGFMKFYAFLKNGYFTDVDVIYYDQSCITMFFSKDKNLVTYFISENLHSLTLKYPKNDHQ